jgi:DNA-3-methyladenine glycosylase II
MVTSTLGGPAGTRTEWLREVRTYLSHADPVLAELIADRPDFDPRRWITDLPPMDLFGALLFQIVGQQLSVAATRRTLGRIQDRFGGRLPSPADVLGTHPARFRDAGLSWRKVATLRELAERLTDGRLDADELAGLPDDDLIAALTEISGIGPWTAQGALIVALGREDVVLPGDLALRRAVRATYGLDHLPAEDEVVAIAEKWRPYRSLATAYLFAAAFEQAHEHEDRAGHAVGLPPAAES